MILLSMSNQNGAPIEIARIVRSHPRGVSQLQVSRQLLCQPTSWPKTSRSLSDNSLPSLRVMVGLVGSSSSLYSTETVGRGFFALAFACPPTAARSTGSVESLRAICTVSALATSVSTAASTIVHTCVLRLYQPLTRSIASLNQPSIARSEERRVGKECR